MALVAMQVIVAVQNWWHCQSSMGLLSFVEKLLMDNGTYHMSSLTKLAHRAIHQILWSLAT